MGIMQMLMGGGAGGINPREHFDVTLWTGNGSSPRTITQDGNFTPDLIWNKARSHGYHHYVHDSVRGFGSNKELVPSGTYQEGDTSNHNTPAHGYVSGAGSGSFTLGAGSSNNLYNNGSGETYVAWTWNAGGSTVSNTDGSITSSVRANTDAGFSIVSYTGNGTAGATVGHGLNAEPFFIFSKNRVDDASVGGQWYTYHKSLGNNKALQLQSNLAAFSTSAMNSTTPTSSVFARGSFTAVNKSGDDYIAYCFAPVAGFSKFGTYSGGTNPKVITCGFEPTFVIIRRTDSGNHWIMVDSERGGTMKLGADESVAENDSNTVGSASQNIVVFESDGFKLTTTDAGTNTSGGTYVYAAWA